MFKILIIMKTVPDYSVLKSDSSLLKRAAAVTNRRACTENLKTFGCQRRVKKLTKNIFW